MDESSRSSISRAQDLERMGEFWDIHDFTDYDSTAPDVLVFHGSTHPISKDPLILEAYDLLKAKYRDKLKDLESFNLAPILIPPVTAILLSRLPDNCCDPTTVVAKILELRQELAPIRHRFSDLEARVYNKDATLKDLEQAQKAVLADAAALEKFYGLPFSDNIMVRWFLDNISLILTLLSQQKIDLEELIALVATIIPPIRDRLGVVAPSRIFDYANKARNIKAYNSLIHAKLGIDLG